jgi:hypothetical protein
MADEERGNEEVAEHRDLERVLSQLRPAGSRIDRDRFLFLAGRASVETVGPATVFGRWVWPAATLVSSVAVAVLSVLLATRTESAGSRADSMHVQADRPHVSAVAEVSATPASQQVEAEPLSSPGEARSLAGFDPPAASTPPEAARELVAGSNYPRLRSFVLAYGVEALPEPAPIRPSAADSATDDEPRTQREMLRQLINNVRNKNDLRNKGQSAS